MFDWLTEIVRTAGYLGIAFLMLAENVFPPIPSELIMPLAGFAAARGDLDPVLAVLSGSVGSMAGALFWFWLGRRLGLSRLKSLAARHGRWLTLSTDDVDRACHWFGRHGATAVLIGRLVPAVRTLISVPAGLADMPLPRFILFSTLGTVGWNSLLVGAGYVLEGNYERVADYVNPVSTAVLAGALAWYVYRVATWRAQGE